MELLPLDKWSCLSFEILDTMSEFVLFKIQLVFEKQEST